MKLLMLSLDDYPHCGGKSTHMSNLIEGLNENGVNTTVLSRSDLNNKKILIRKLLAYPYKFLCPSKYMYLRKKIEFDLFYKMIKKHLKDNHYDSISCQDALACTAVGRLKQYEKITLTMHTYFGLEYTLDNNILNENNKYYKKLLNLEQESLMYAKNVVAVDERIYNHVSDVSKKLNYKVNLYSVINFTNTSIYNEEKIPHDEYKIMCVRRLVEKNGVFYAVKAMKYVKNNMILDVYGDGPEVSKLKAFIDNNKLEDKVKLCGAIDNSLLAKLYKKCDCIVVPSITVNGLQEATSISALEAMSSKIPVIASNIGGLKQLIKNNENGLLVDEQDAKAIAKNLDYLYENKDVAEKLAENARKYVLENHSHIVAAKKYLEIFIS